MRVLATSLSNVQPKYHNVLTLRLCNLLCDGKPSYLQRQALVYLRKCCQKAAPSSCGEEVAPFDTLNDLNQHFRKRLGGTPCPVPSLQQDFERIHCRYVFENSSHYKNTTASPPIAKQIITNEYAEQLLNTDWTRKNFADLFTAWKKLSYHSMCPDSVFQNEMYRPILEEMTAYIRNVNKEILKMILKFAIPIYPRLRTLSCYGKFCNNVSLACENEIKGTVDELLVWADLLCRNGMQKTVAMTIVLRKLSAKPHRLTGKNLVQLLYYLSTVRKCNINMYELECRLEECLSDLTINEVGIASLGFFKTRTSLLNNTLMFKITQKLMEEMDDTRSFTITSILKIIRYSSCSNMPEICQPLFQKLATTSVDVPLAAFMQAAHLAAKVHTYNKKFMDRVAQKLLADLGSARLKDLERIMFGMIMVSPDTYNSVYQAVIDELLLTYNNKRSYEIWRNPELLPRILTHFSYQNLYPVELISHVLERRPEYWNHNPPITRELISLYLNVKLELPSYTGPTLKSSTCQDFLRKYLSSIQSDQITTSAMKSMKQILIYWDNISNVPLHMDHILPQYATQDLVIGFEENNKPVSAEGILSQIPFGEMKIMSADNLKHVKWVAIVPVSNSHMIEGAGHYSGLIRAKLRHLRLAGYIPVTITRSYLVQCVTPVQRTEYIYQLVLSAVNQTSETVKESVSSTREA